MRGRPYLFVSHASRDNARLRPVIVALLDAGVPLWFDKPQHDDIRLPFQRFAGYIEAGEDYREALDDRAVPASSGFLIFPSEHTAENKQVFIEVRNALERHRQAQRSNRSYPLIAAFLHNDALQHLGDDLDHFQGLKTIVAETPDGWVLTDAGREMTAELARRALVHCEECTVRPLPGAGAVRGARGADADPFLVDRQAQRESAHDWLGRIMSRSGDVQSRLPLFIAFGHAEEEPAQVGAATLPKRVLRRLPLDFAKASDNVKRLDWPVNAKASDAHGFARIFDAGMSEAFPPVATRGQRTSEADGRAAVARRIHDENILRIVYGDITSQRPIIRSFGQLVAHMRAWCTYWNAFPFEQLARNGRPLLFPVLTISLAEPRRHLDFAKGKARAERKAVEVRDQRLLAGLKRRSTVRRLSRGLSHIEPVLLPPLDSVTAHCIAEWVENDTETFAMLVDDKPGRDALVASLRALFAGRDAMPMRDWAQAARGPLRKFAEDIG